MFFFFQQKLKFELGMPLPIHFLRRYSKAAVADAFTHITSKYFVELAATDYQLCEYLPSQVIVNLIYIYFVIKILMTVGHL